ncbi:MAG: transcriptional regulator [Deltaproteobacteria bacterium]|nr:transcriptional regulator [Deltaproteobacteria bacterium]
MEFIESPLFTRIISNYIDDTEYAAMQIELALRPEAGSIIPGSGGLRKIRWAGKGKGKRGGLRVIYYWQARKGEIWMLTVYAKNEAEDIPISVLRDIKKEVEK